MAAESLLASATVDEAVTQLRNDDIMVTNNELREAVQPIVDDAANRGVPNFNVIYLDDNPQGTDAFSFARQVVDELGGTTVVRTPDGIGTASTDFSRAAIAHAERAMMGTSPDDPAGLDYYLNELTGYVVPWTLYSIIVALIIIAAFAGLIFYWIRTRPTS
ncbi:DUF6676 family protein [uncultured Corynebacterium sp.]|uniref:Rv1476 family membrane protein n=1 Tax=uncultured Corynebacterium sp. TaxID=159447 RepID=UPI002637BF60|nr:DUF6676 family protein [uncultured Corynebacterium sp.]